MKVSLATAVLAGCGLVFALPPGQGNYYQPGSGSGSGYAGCSDPRWYGCSGGQYPSRTLSIRPSITHSLGVPSFSVPTSTGRGSSSTSTRATSTGSTSTSGTSTSGTSTSGTSTSGTSTSGTSTSGTSTSSTSIGSTSTTTTTTTTSTTITTTSTTTTTTTSTTSSAPPAVITCELGTAMGYQEGDSVTLDTQSGTGCNRWGWYETPTLAELQSSISGILYVGAGGNVIANAIAVGTWTATASPTGGVTVTYSLNAGYFIDEAHIDLDCLPIDTCAPGQYTFNSGALPNVSVYANPTPIQYPTCSGGSTAYLIIHASVNVLTTATTCEPPVAT